MPTIIAILIGAFILWLYWQNVRRADEVQRMARREFAKNNPQYFRQPSKKIVGSCPCLYTTPCNPNCTCVKPYMSHGCSRCCSYGSLEQRKMAATRLASLCK